MTDKQVWSASGIGTLYHDLDIKNFTGDEDALKIVNGYIQNIHQMRGLGRGLLCWGENGLGKTFLMIEVLKAASKEKNKNKLNFTIQMTSLSEIVNMYTEGWYSQEAKENFTKKIIKKDFLLIDDVDKIYMPKSENNVVISAFDLVVRQRVNNNRPILMTTNETPAAFKEIFGKSISSLLAGHCVPIQFCGIDYRRQFPAAKK